MSAIHSDQSQTLGAINSLAAVITEISKDPKTAFKRPIGQWLPWLQEEGYNCDGLDLIFLSIVPQDRQTQDLDILTTVYNEASSTGKSTLYFLFKLRNQQPDLFRHCFAELSKQLISLESINATAGGKLTGPAATFIKKHPAYSTAILAGGLLTGWLLIERRLTDNAETSLKAAIAKNAIQATVDASLSTSMSNMANDVRAADLDPAVMIENVERHPVEFIDNAEGNVDDLKGKLLTTENIDKFVKVAMKDEAGQFITAEEKELLKEVKDVRNVWEYVDDGDNIGRIEYWMQQRQESLDELYTLVKDDDLELINRYITDEPKVNTSFNWNHYFRIKREYDGLDRVISRIEYNNKTIEALKKQAFKAAYEKYVESGTPDSLDNALWTLTVKDLQNNAVITLRYEEDESTLERLVIEDESAVLDQIIEDSVKDASAYLQSVADNEFDDIFKYFHNEWRGIYAEIESYVDNKL